ncbi:SDR family oxidoreductase [Catenuloplanes japonicus]|uniref:SDR family oxidoreductase n=1 Tax=Catenuloplanes japonicus TaxID=33876 RepID=UPI000524893E|nr:SDR family oxidoreductase [Catenuloplanes japonicus]
MKIVVIGGTGQIGSRLVARLTAEGHEAVAASPKTGVDSITGEGLEAALDGTDVVVDVTNAPAWGDEEVLRFFTTSTGNLLAAAQKAGVGHHVALTIVGAERMPDSGYLRAKVAQENLIKESGVPYTIVRATQFFEFIAGIAQNSTVGTEVHIPPAQFQPVAVDDVVAAVADAATGPAANETVQVAGPEVFRFAEIVARVLADAQDPRTVVEDPAVGYFGAALPDDGLVPAPGTARLGTLDYAKWSSSN